MTHNLSPWKELDMIRWIHATSLLVTAIAVFAFVALPGCDTGKGAKKDDNNKVKDKDKGKDKDDHEHGEIGPHGGPIIEWPPLHAEFTADHANKMAIVYILDKDAKKAPSEEASRFSKVELIVTSEKPNIKLELAHDAKKSGPGGHVFTGTHEFLAKPTAFKGHVSAILDEKSKKPAPTPFGNDFEYDPAKLGAEKKK
jgi:hypothetical protein